MTEPVDLVVAAMPMASWSPSDLQPSSAVTTLTCFKCSCVFLPDVDSDTIYPDRYEVAGGCHDDCPCHDVPAVLPRAEADPIWEDAATGGRHRA